MTPSGADRYGWIETLVRLAGKAGFNEVRLRWKLRAWQDRLADRGSDLAGAAASAKVSLKICPACRALNGVDRSTCSQCGAVLLPRPVEAVARVGRRLGLGVTPESFLSVALVAVYAIEALGGRSSNFFSQSVYDLVALGGNFLPLTTGGEWWRLWTSVLLHAGVFHIAFNVMALLIVMPMIREVYGAAKGMAVFFVAGVGASLASAAWGVFTGSHGVSIGASGAISGLIGLALVWGHRDGTSFGIMIRDTMARWVLYTFLFGILAHADNAAHVGGWLIGGALALVLPPTNLNRGSAGFWRLLGAVSWLAVVAGVLWIARLALAVNA